MDLSEIGKAFCGVFPRSMRVLLVFAMTERANLVKERDADRLCVLLAIYDLTGGRPHVRLFLKDVFPTTGIPEERADAAARHLNQARLVTLGPSRTVQILQAGIDAAERVEPVPSRKRTKGMTRCRSSPETA